jgi:type II secretory ATPase GspE/PulE/Tfp pilus assembly ATPase PilB-like protein
MVAPQDSSALDYVRRILAYLNCSLKTERIAAKVHQSLLSAYLNHTHTSSSRKQTPKNKAKVAQSEQPSQSANDSQVPDRKPLSHSNDVPSPTTSPSASRRETSSESSSTSAQASEQSSTLPGEAPPILAVTPVSTLTPATGALPPLEVQPLYLSRPIEFVATLAPQQLLQELLARVLIGGIGRLYFERQPEQGRILWSQDGVLQSVVEGLTLSVFQGVILELKRVVNVPLIPVTQPKQVEIERRYQQESLLLRLRLMPGNYGEEATLQVLRGVALKFYQRQQLEKLSQDALKLAEQLQRKLNELRDRSSQHSLPLEALPALNQILQNLDEQLEGLAEPSENQQSDTSDETD